MANQETHGTDEYDCSHNKNEKDPEQDLDAVIKTAKQKISTLAHRFTSYGRTMMQSEPFLEEIRKEKERLKDLFVRAHQGGCADDSALLEKVLRDDLLTPPAEIQELKTRNKSTPIAKD